MFHVSLTCIRTITAVFLFSAIDGSVCLELQVKTLTAAQFSDDSFQLRLCGRHTQTPSKTVTLTFKQSSVDF